MLLFDGSIFKTEAELEVHLYCHYISHEKSIPRKRVTITLLDHYGIDVTNEVVCEVENYVEKCGWRDPCFVMCAVNKIKKNLEEMAQKLLIEKAFKESVNDMRRMVDNMKSNMAKLYDMKKTSDPVLKSDIVPVVGLSPKEMSSLDEMQSMINNMKSLTNKLLDVQKSSEPAPKCDISLVVVLSSVDVSSLPVIISPVVVFPEVQEIIVSREAKSSEQEVTIPVAESSIKEESSIAVIVDAVVITLISESVLSASASASNSLSRLFTGLLSFVPNIALYVSFGYFNNLKFNPISYYHYQNDVLFYFVCIAMDVVLIFDPGGNISF